MIKQLLKQLIKHRTIVLSLLLIPLVNFVLVLNQRAHAGPFYLTPDPDYAYLMNAIGILQPWIGVEHIDHPGTTTQVLLALIFKVYYNLIPSDHSLVIDILHRPEDYLLVAHHVSNVILMTSLFLFGLTAYYATRKLSASLIAQSSVFLPISGGFFLSRISPESLLLSLAYVLSALALFLVGNRFWNHKIIFMQIGFSSSGSPRKEALHKAQQISLNVYSIGLGFLLGLGIVTKLTFLPLFLFVIAVTKKISHWWVILLSAFITAYVATYPIHDKLYRVFDWIQRLFIGSDKYGYGPQTVIHPEYVMKNIAVLLQNEVGIIMVFLAIVLIAPTVLKNGRLSPQQFGVSPTWVVLSSIVSIFVSFLLVLKHFSPHYLLASIPLFGIALALLWLLTMAIPKKSKLPIQILLCLAISFALFFRASSAATFFSSPYPEPANHTEAFMSALRFGYSWSDKDNIHALREVYGKESF